MRLKPLGNQIVVTRVEPDDTTKSGLYVPTAVKTSTEEAIVVAVGPGLPLASTGALYELPVNVDDRVLYRRHNEVEVEVGDTKYLIMDVDAVLAILESEGGDS